MKILLTFLTFGKDIFAGMENSIYQLSKGINEIGATAVIFTSFAYGGDESVDGIRVYRSRHLPTDFTGGDIALRRRILTKKDAITRDLLAVIENEKPNYIMSWDPLWGFLQYLEIHTLTNIPLLLSYRVVNIDSTLRKANGFPFRKSFALSQYLRNEIVKRGVSTEIEILPNSIDYEAYSTRDVTTASSRKVILCNARLSPEKGIKYLLKAFARIIKTHPEFNLHLCSGEFPFGNWQRSTRTIMNLVEKLDLREKVQFLPNQEWNKIPQLIARSYVSVLPSISESFGRSALESLAVGIPLIATRVGNLPDLVGTDGILIDPRSSTQLYDNLLRLIEDETVYCHYLNKGKRRAKMYDRRLVAMKLCRSLATL